MQQKLNANMLFANMTEFSAVPPANLVVFLTMLHLAGLYFPTARDFVEKFLIILTLNLTILLYFPFQFSLLLWKLIELHDVSHFILWRFRKKLCIIHNVKALNAFTFLI